MGEKPSFISSKKAITEREWKSALRKNNWKNPIFEGQKYLEYLESNLDFKYQDAAKEFGVSKARVCQMVALYNRLPSRITEYLMNTDEPEIIKYFTERRLRPLTLLVSDDDKIRKFDKMKEALAN